MEYLELTFITSENKKHVERLYNARPNMTEAEIRKEMISLSEDDVPNEDGVLLYVQPASARYVKIEKTIDEIFDDKIVLPKPAPRGDDNDEIQADDTPKPLRTKISLGQMSKSSPRTIAKVFNNQLICGGNSPESVARYLANVTRTQKLNNLIIENKQIPLNNFSPVLAEMYGEKVWSETMIKALPAMQNFFTPPDWYILMKKYQKMGKENTARLFGDADYLNYPAARKYMKELLRAAKTAFDEYRHKLKEYQENLPHLLGSLQETS